MDKTEDTGAEGYTESFLEKLRGLTEAIAPTWFSFFVVTSISLTIGHGLLGYQLPLIASWTFMMLMVGLGIATLRLVPLSIITLLRGKIVATLAALVLLMSFAVSSFGSISAIWVYEYFSGVSSHEPRSVLDWWLSLSQLALLVLNFMPTSSSEGATASFQHLKFGVGLLSFLYCIFADIFLSKSTQERYF